MMLATLVLDAAAVTAWVLGILWGESALLALVLIGLAQIIFLLSFIIKD
jgi:hypothetical protein